MRRYEILGSTWFGTIGIVAVKSEDGWKCYIGKAMGSDIDVDEQLIAALGMPTGKSIAVGAFPNLDPDKHLS